MMKPVNVEFASPELAKKIVAGSACVSCLKPTRPSSSSPSSTSAHTCLSGSGIEKPKDVEQGEEVMHVKIIKPAVPTQDLETDGDQSTLNQIPVPARLPLEPNKPWTIDEDRSILVSCQAAPNIETGFRELTTSLVNRSYDEVSTNLSLP